MKIVEKFKTLIPPLEASEYEGLETAIVRDGCRDPLVVWEHDGESVLIDGHNRYGICDKHGIGFKTENMQFDSENDAEIWIIKNQFGRRNLSAYDRSILALRLEPAIKVKAKENQVARKGLQSGTTKQKSAELKPVETRKEIAKSAGVSHDTIAKVKVIQEKATPEIKEDVRSGKISINAAHKEITGQKKTHVSNNSGENEWYTPAKYIESARKVMGEIHYDPASSKKANEIVKANVYYTKEDDGLSNLWSGNVWMNPPYAQPLCSKFCERLCNDIKDKHVEQAIVLVNNATETAWFSNIAIIASSIIFPTSRIKFLDPSGDPKGAPLQGQAFLYFGENHKLFLKEFGQYGWGCIVK